MPRTWVLRSDIKKQRDGVAKCTPNLLPCRIEHNGEVDACKRLWDPQQNQDGSQTVHFRGRRLKGKGIALPDGYQGIMVEQTDNINIQSPPQELDLEDQENEELEQTQIEEFHVMRPVATFNEVVVWGHEAVPEPIDDPHIRGLTEWINFAEAMHDMDEMDTKTKS